MEQPALSLPASRLLADLRLSLTVDPRAWDWVVALLRCAQQAVGGERREALRLIKATPDLSARGLTHDPDQLAGQLTGRLLPSRLPAITRLLRTAAAKVGSGWLRPVSTSLTNPCGPLLHPLIGHTCDVWGLAVTPDGRRVLSASKDGTVRVWDVGSGLQLATLVGHTDEVWSFAVTPYGELAVSVSNDGTLRQDGWKVTELTGGGEPLFPPGVLSVGSHCSGVPSALGRDTPAHQATSSFCSGVSGPEPAARTSSSAAFSGSPRARSRQIARVPVRPIPMPQ